jgi:hypothetical protein
MRPAQAAGASAVVLSRQIAERRMGDAMPFDLADFAGT